MIDARKATQIAPSEDEPVLDLRAMTNARVALGRHGSGQPTRAQLSFQLDHARAREAVWRSVDTQALGERLNRAGLSVIKVESQAADRSIYVRRPDLGRLLTPQSVDRLHKAAADSTYDIVIVVADGLSSSAVDLNAIPLIEALVPKLHSLGLAIAPVVLANQARVALGDPVGEALGVRLTILMVGERPGLSASDSLGVYLTYDPKSGTPDSGRNCISNIREGGMTISEAADLITSLIRDMIQTRVSGVALKAAVGKHLDSQG
ncbi:ethanolamine ammonia-lyase subunit EutC [Neorhizobium galegae]|uniref:ethanolamine ammonia-lyase subunit EutC n=1 Tax=Neorhizobium galegae TaxID=399 RepID=UPI001AEA1393|nr:ethanolamine ammonia-lyase subunit EutC [Neorhizobium galegae]